LRALAPPLKCCKVFYALVTVKTCVLRVKTKLKVRNFFASLNLPPPPPGKTPMTAAAVTQPLKHRRINCPKKDVMQGYVSGKSAGRQRRRWIENIME